MYTKFPNEQNSLFLFFFLIQKIHVLWVLSRAGELSWEKNTTLGVKLIQKYKSPIPTHQPIQPDAFLMWKLLTH
jgi:hypothetical protein